MHQQVRKLASRRAFLAAAAALGASATSAGRALAQQKPIINAPALLENEIGGYRVLPAGSVFCGGVVPYPGREIVHALAAPWVPLREGWAFIESHLAALKLPMQALCGMELRSPAQLDWQGFRAFNGPYVEQLRRHQLIIGNYSAVCRTNVVPAADAPREAMLHAFSYCAPASAPTPTFCVSGTADIDERGKIVAEGDTSAAGMRARIAHCVEAIGERLAQPAGEPVLQVGENGPEGVRGDVQTGQQLVGDEARQIGVDGQAGVGIERHRRPLRWSDHS